MWHRHPVDRHLEELAGLVEMLPAARCCAYCRSDTHSRLPREPGPQGWARRRCSCRCWPCCCLAEERCRSGTLLGTCCRLWGSTSHSCRRGSTKVSGGCSKRIWSGAHCSSPWEQQHELQQHVCRMQVADVVGRLSLLLCTMISRWPPLPGASSPPGSMAASPSSLAGRLYLLRLTLPACQRRLHCLLPLDSCIDNHSTPASTQHT